VSKTAIKATKVKKARSSISAEVAREIGSDFLLMKVGNLLAAGEPRLPPSQVDGRRVWQVPILLGNVRQGLLGEVGELLIDAETGRVIFTDQDKKQIEARAYELYQRAKAS
jgi:hypothetical protein